MDSKAQDEFIDKLWDIFEEIPEEDRFVFANCLIDVASICGTNNHVERIGLLHLKILEADKQFDEEFESEKKTKPNLSVVTKTAKDFN